MLGVSPPQKGLAQDSGAVDKKSLQQHSELKKEFDQKLKEQLKERPQSNANSAKDSKPDQKTKLQDKDELRADRNQKKPSGGPKKKMVEPEEQNETTISNIMASSESEVGIADHRKDLAPVESESSTEIKNESKTGITQATPGPVAQTIDQSKDGLAKAVALAEGTTAPKTGEAMVAAEALAQQQHQAQASSTDQALVQQALAAKNGAKTTAVEITPEMIAAFRAAQENALSEAGDKTLTKESATQDSQLALQMQQLANQAQPAVTAQASATAGQEGASAAVKGTDSSSLLAKSLENLKSMSAAAAAGGNQAAAAPMAAGAMAAMGFGIGASSKNSEQGLEVNQQTEGLEQTAGFENLEQSQNAQMMENIQLMQSQQNQQAPVEELTFDQQLSAEVGFEPEVEDNKESSKSALLQKMKAFEAEKGLTPKEANSFEIKVLALLQQERNELAHQKYGSGEGGASGGFSHKENQGDTMSDSMKDVSQQALGTPDASLHAGQTQPAFKSHMSTMVDRAGLPLSPQAMAEHREENIQHVMSSAKLLAIKGGGEMTVKMSPDGMGPIELKVMMQDGKVNIQMQTQDKSVKKLIEDSLTELKSGLAAQKIHVDHVKIDTVSATNTDNSASFQPQQGSSDAQGRQQEFWKQFRENFGNQGRKSSYGDVASVPARQQAAPNALQPVTTSAARNGARTGSTINRVA